jgi:hypothetical protein
MMVIALVVSSYKGHSCTTLGIVILPIYSLTTIVYYFYYDSLFGHNTLPVI